jgi:hypothetical protein
MSTTAHTHPTPARTHTRDPAPRGRHGPVLANGLRRRAPTRIVAGLLVIALGFVIGAVTVARLNKAVDVLAMARTVMAGSVVADGDLAVMHIVADPALRVVAATRRSQIVGQVAAMALMAGSLLTEQALGPAADPGAGQSILALGVKTGHIPAGLAAGASVLVLVVPPGGGVEPTAVVQAPAVVREVQPPDASGLTVITLQLASATAERVASAAGDVTILVQGG